MKDKHFGAAVDKIEDQRKPDDFIGHRKPAAKPKMPQVQILSSGPEKARFGVLFQLNPPLRVGEIAFGGEIALRAVKFASTASGWI